MVANNIYLLVAQKELQLGNHADACQYSFLCFVRTDEQVNIAPSLGVVQTGTEQVNLHFLAIDVSGYLKNGLYFLMEN